MLIDITTDRLIQSDEQIGSLVNKQKCYEYIIIENYKRLNQIDVLTIIKKCI